MLPRPVHCYLDYIVSFLLLLLPLMIKEMNPLASAIALSLGISTLLYNALTDYEIGFIRLINFRIHLLIDILVGVILATSPWLLDFENEFFWPFFILGIGKILLGFISVRKISSQEKM